MDTLADFESVRIVMVFALGFTPSYMAIKSATICVVFMQSSFYTVIDILSLVRSLYRYQCRFRLIKLNRRVGVANETEWTPF